MKSAHAFVPLAFVYWGVVGGRSDFKDLIFCDCEGLSNCDQKVLCCFEAVYVDQLVNSFKFLPLPLSLTLPLVCV